MYALDNFSYLIIKLEIACRLVDWLRCLVIERLPFFESQKYRVNIWLAPSFLRFDNVAVGCRSYSTGRRIVAANREKDK